MSSPTRTSAAGTFQTRGEDAIQFLDETGEVVSRVSSDGTQYCKDCVMKDGTSLSGLKNQVQSIQFSGLPPVIDTGTF